MASIQQAESAVEKGVSLITHLFNAMIPVIIQLRIIIIIIDSFIIEIQV